MTLRIMRGFMGERPRKAQSAGWLRTGCVAILVAFALVTGVRPICADPCGMVPPIYDGRQTPITRVGEQQTYVFHRDGVEAIVIRPGFSGKVDEFGMLIPFPTPPAVRKVADHIFPHIAAAVDPPEVVVDLRPSRWFSYFADRDDYSVRRKLAFKKSEDDDVRVLREEAVGMYEVAVLEAGSALALKRWMDDHGYRYPDGMDQVANEYVAAGWCFVAVKTKVGQKQGVDPQPGQRAVNPRLPNGSSFDGHVQAMGFRFRTEKPVVPMRLSAFNDGELRNIVYVLTDGPRKIRSIPEKFVVRQIPGDLLMKKLTELLPLRVIGGTEKNLTRQHLDSLVPMRNPAPKNGAAKELFAADLLAVSSGRLSLPQEEEEKRLLRIGERLGLRGPDIDALHAQTLKQSTEKTVQRALADIKSMTLTVVDGDFPREVLAGENLTFTKYKMPAERNNPEAYDAKIKGPAPQMPGVRRVGEVHHGDGNSSNVAIRSRHVASPFVWGSISLFVGFGAVIVRRRRRCEPPVSKSNV